MDDDATLWARSQAGDREAFGRLFECHSRAIYAYCFRLTADAERAADLTSITFLEAWRRRGATLRREKVLSWLFGVATNVLRNERRARRRYREALNRLPPARDEQDLADETAEKLDSESRMREALDVLRRLPQGEREIFVLSAWQGLTPEDAADALGISAGAARTRLSRARKRLALLTTTEGSASSTRTKGVGVP